MIKPPLYLLTKAVFLWFDFFLTNGFSDGTIGGAALAPCILPVRRSIL